MKKLLILFAALLLLSLQACNDYLTVNPRDRIADREVFSSAQGFQNALAGIYLEMQSNKSYGQALTMTTIERLVSSWDVDATDKTSEQIGRFNYSDESVQTAFEDIYLQQYRIITNLNAILGNLDTYDPAIFPDEDLYRMIKGESLALRAFIHFDLLRLWGPVPTRAQGSDRVLPYVKVKSTVPNSRVSYDQFKADLLEDMSQADTLLRKSDPILKYSLTDIGNPSAILPKSSFFAYRYVSMNYYAVKALEARAFLWFGDHAAAFEAAKAVISAVDPSGTAKYRLGIGTDLSQKDFTLLNEHIFALAQSKLSDVFTNNFANGNLKRGSNPSTVNTGLYGNSGTDIRETYLWNTVPLSASGFAYIFQKYNVPLSTLGKGFTDQNRIPLIRLSEMFLISVETAPTTALAQRYWDAFRTSRNLVNATLPTSPLLVQDELLKEYRKEFFAEGQAFYAYKRLDAPLSKILWAPPTATLNYVVPLPKTETSN